MTGVFVYIHNYFFRLAGLTAGGLIFDTSRMAWSNFMSTFNGGAGFFFMV
jgi:hypothetical protein